MLKTQLKNYKIILASGSPRRQQFFRDLNLNFEIRLKEIEEIYPENLNAEEITNYLAALKANAFDGQIGVGELLVTSDTIVWHNETALGKPKDYDDAFRILKSLSNSTHQVITSVCFKTKDKLQTIFDITKVTFGVLSDIHRKDARCGTVYQGRRRSGPGGRPQIFAALGRSILHGRSGSGNRVGPADDRSGHDVHPARRDNGGAGKSRTCH